MTDPLSRIPEIGCARHILEYTTIAVLGEINVMEVSIFYDAANTGKLGRLREAMMSGEIDISENDNWAIQWAAENGHLEIVKLLTLSGMADIKALDNRAIRLAANNGHLETVKYLVDSGVDVAEDSCIQSILWAAGNGHLECVKFLASAMGEKGVLHDRAIQWAAYYGHLEIVKYLVLAGMDVTVYDNAAIKSAAFAGHLDVLRFLILTVMKKGHQLGCGVMKEICERLTIMNGKPADRGSVSCPGSELIPMFDYENMRYDELLSIIDMMIVNKE